MRKLVLIDWIDSHSHGRWISSDSLEEACGPANCQSIGWVIADKNEHITIASHTSDNEVTGDMTIPHKAIIRIKEVTMAKTKSKPKKAKKKPKKVKVEDYR